VDLNYDAAQAGDPIWEPQTDCDRSSVQASRMDLVFALTDFKDIGGLFNAFDCFGICFVLAMSAGKIRPRLTRGLTLPS